MHERAGEQTLLDLDLCKHIEVATLWKMKPFVAVVRAISSRCSIRAKRSVLFGNIRICC